MVTADVIVSFDVESLFTKVPIDVTVEAARQKLENDSSPPNCTTLPPSHITDLPNLILRSTYCHYNGSIDKQTEGAAIRERGFRCYCQPLYGEFRRTCGNIITLQPYNTFTILARDSIENFLQHLNHQQPSIYFTKETERNKKFAFLDTAFTREPNGRLTTSVYRKPTYMINI